MLVVQVQALEEDLAVEFRYRSRMAGRSSGLVRIMGWEACFFLIVGRLKISVADLISIEMLSG